MNGKSAGDTGQVYNCATFDHICRGTMFLGMQQSRTHRSAETSTDAVQEFAALSGRGEALTNRCTDSGSRVKRKTRCCLYCRRYAATVGNLGRGNNFSRRYLRCGKRTLELAICSRVTVVSGAESSAQKMTVAKGMRLLFAV